MSQEAVRGFFGAWNRREMDEAMQFIADECVYDDYGFPEPHKGKASVRELFDRVARESPSVTFEIDAMTGEHDVGALWHICIDGVPGPRGVSYYKFDDDDKLISALDAVDPGRSSS